MGCARPLPRNDRDFFLRFREKIERFRVPIYGAMELTHRCNLHCLHCYLARDAGSPEKTQRELTAQQLFPIIDEIAEAGCLDLLLTGGEPMIRKDFCEVYRHAIARGLLVTVFTNGTLIAAHILDVFAEFPPRGVEITLYGATQVTYERITGVPGSYERCIRGIEGLLGRGIRLVLKTILMTHNRDEFFAIEKMAEGYGLPFRFDAGISPRLDGDLTPIGLRVPAAEAVEKEFAVPKMMQRRREFFEQMEGYPLSDALYACGAGHNMFHIDPYGKLKPCLMVPEPEYDLLKGSFEEGWKDVLPLLDRKKPGPRYVCNRCELKALCDACPAFFELETGSEQERSEYLCASAHHRFGAIKEMALHQGKKENAEIEHRATGATLQSAV
ncbi:MAG: radical SAM protein [Planctomycetota bacterium]